MSSKTEKVLSDYETSVFCRQMALLIKAGIAPLEGIEIMLQDFKFDDTTPGSAPISRI